MARYWDNKEVAGRGTKYCLVIDPEDGTHPIRTYGWSQDEVLEKIARTAETAQQTIGRLRNTPAPAAPAAPARTAAPAASRVKPLSTEEQMQATADLSNPAKAPEAVKTLLRGVGFDVDQSRIHDDARRIGAIAQEWERRNPEFPMDPRNQRLLLDKAILMVGFQNITPEVLDAAYRELLAHDMLFESSREPVVTPPNAPNGNSDSRIDRQPIATSYRQTDLRGSAPVVNRKPKYTRAEIDALNSKQLRDKIENEPGFKDWYNHEFSAAG